jgi:hypothetical protein
MTARGTTTRVWRRLAIALVIATSASAIAAPAGAQFWEDRNRQQPQQPARDYFPFRFFGGDRGSGAFNPFGQPARPAQVDSPKAPSPRKVDTPPTSTVLVIGDSLADWLGYGLEEAFADTPEIGIVRKIRPTSGLVRYEQRNDSLEWAQAAKDILATEKPSAIVVMLGLNDRQSLRERAVKPGAQPGAAAAGQAPATASQDKGQEQPSADSSTAEVPPQPSIAATETQRTTPGGNYEFHTDKWGELYDKRIDDMIAVLKAKGVPVVWVGLPAIRGPRATSDMSYLDELYRARAEKAGITYVDVWDGFVDEGGRFAVQGPDFEGQIRRLRSGDGVHFTKPGAVKLAHYVEHELRRLMSNHVVPVALPAPEETPNGTAVGARPAIGPVVPLNAAIGGEGGDLLGAGGRIDPAKADPIVTRVLGHGDALAAPPGRADDFSWPRGEAGTVTDARPVAPAPAPPAKAAAKTDGKALPEAKPQAAIEAKPDNKLDGAPESPPAAAPPTPPAPTPPTPAARKKLPEPTGQTTGLANTQPAPTRPRRARADIDGAPPRPPLPIGPGVYNSR